MDVGTYIENLKGIDVKSVFMETLKEFEVFFIDANVEQLYYGKRSTGEKIGRYQSNEYAALKYSENPLAGFGNIDLILTGAFKNGIFIEYTDEAMIFDSRGKEKENGMDLLYHFGDDVLGVSGDNLQKLSPDFCEQFINKFYERLAV